MSGIAGIFYRDNRPVDPADLERMLNILKHRGPDGRGTWHEGSVGFGHLLLHTTPESLNEKQPLTSRSGHLTLTADARIDNRAELLAALNLPYPPAEVTDSALILAAYEKWGEACPEHLLGDFVFAIWDRQKQRLFCARDHMGAKPFFYYQSDRIFAFASEIKGLTCLPEVPCQLNEVSVAYHLVSEFKDEVSTFYQDIFRLPPAHKVVVSFEKAQSHCYWSLDPTYELRLASDEAYIEAFREIFFEAVRCRLRSAFPMGSTLSGGLDSSSVTCVARKLLAKENNTPLHTFSYVYDTITQCDERPYINAVLAQEGYIPHFMLGDQLSPLVDAERAFWHLEQPTIGSAMYFPWNLCRAAQQADVRNLLTGFDGDAVVSHGFAYLMEISMAGQWTHFFAEAETVALYFDTPNLKIVRHYSLMALQEMARRQQWLKFINGTKEISRRLQLSHLQLFLNYGFKPLVPKSVRQLWRRLYRCNQSNSGVRPFINPSFAHQTRIKKRSQSLSQFHSKPVTLRENHWLTLTAGIIPLNLELFDRTAAAFAVEARHPFMDKRLVEFCLALPPNQRLSQGWTRWILHRAMASILPASVQLRRTKTNLGPNFVHGLLTFERETLDEILHADINRIEGYVEINSVQEAYQRLLSQSNPSVNDIMTVWTVVTLTLWLHYSGLLPRNR